MALFNMLMFGFMASALVHYTEGTLLTGGGGTVIYLAMTLGVLLSIAKTLEKRR